MTSLSQALAAAAQTRLQLTHPSAPFALEAAPCGAAYSQRFARAPALLTDWLDAGRAFADQPFVHYYPTAAGEAALAAPEVWTYSRFYAAVERLSAYLQHDCALPAGVRVALCAANSPQWLVAFAAASYAGAVLAPMNSMNSGAEMRQVLAELQPALLFCDRSRYQQLQEAGGCGDARVILLEELEQYASALPFAVVARGPQDDALVVYTSGSAARPKGAVFTHDAVCQALYNLEYITAFAALTSPLVMARINAAANAPCLLSCVPYFHVSGLYAQVLSTLKNGRKLVMLPRWSPKHAIELIAREKVTAFSAAPSMVMQLMAESQFGQPEVTGSLIALGFGGSGMPQNLRDALAEKMPNTMSGTGFGMTETGGAGVGASGALFALRSASAGLASPIMQISIQDEKGRELPVGQAGEICLRGPTLMRGYHAQPEQSQAALRGAWLHTGDWGYVDADGYCHVLDRIKDVVNRHGEKIAASEVESCLLQHPAVREVAVVALPDPLTLEQVAAYVVLHPSQESDEMRMAQVKAHAQAHLAAYKVPQTWHFGQEALPRNAMGKVLKDEIRRWLTAA